MRDAWWENKTGPLTTYVGNQIVVWGQSLAFRVGDVVNPQDTTWAFGFANLEQSRIPQWMIHPIWNLPQFGPLQSNFLEGILLPRLQPMWNSCDYADHRYDGECNVNAGSVNNGFPAGVGFDPTGRFGAHLNGPGGYYPGRTAVVPGTSILLPFGQPVQNSRLIGAPLSNEFYLLHEPRIGERRSSIRSRWLCSAIARCLAMGRSRCRPVEGSGRDGGELGRGSPLSHADRSCGNDRLLFQYLESLSEHLLAAVHQSVPRPLRADSKVGVTGDMPIPMPSSVSEYLPFVGRAEGVYTNHQPVLSFDLIAHPNGVRFTDIGELDAGAGRRPGIRAVADQHR